MEQQERFDVTFEGREGHPKRTFMGHYFTDEEVEALQNGESVSVEVTSKAGNTFLAKLDIGIRSFTDDPNKTYVGVGFANEVPDEWGGHKFTADEKSMLEMGKPVSADDFVSKKSGKTYSATVTYEEVDGRKKIVPHFGA